MPTPLLAVLVLAALMTGCCTPAASPFPVVGPLDDEGVLAVLAERTSGVTTLYAELVLVYEGPEREGSFDAVFHWQQPDRLRLVAFKDVVLASQPIFDLLLREQRYRLELSTDEDAEPELHTGAVKQFGEQHPQFGELFWTREALFLPGAPGARGQARVEQGPEAILVHTQLHSGAGVVWWLEPATLEVQQAQVGPPGNGPYHLEYHAWESAGGRLFPRRVTLHHPARGTRISGLVEVLDVNPEPRPAVFEFSQ